MILTINANAAIDRVLLVSDMEPRGTIRASQVLDCVGGKGADAALVLAELGAPHQLVSFIAGEYGRILERLYIQKGIQYELVWVEGETRVVTVIFETERNCLTQISFPGYSVSADDCQRFIQVVRQHAQHATWAIAAGSLPVGAPVDFYHQACTAVHNAGARVLVDCTGASLVEALKAKPDIIKLNLHEFESTFHTTAHTLHQLVIQGKEVLDANGLETMILTLGEEGMLLIREDLVLHACAPEYKAANPAGAGDAASAAIAHRLSSGDSWNDALRWACAAGAAVVQTKGTAECSLEMVLSILPQVQFLPLPS